MLSQLASLWPRARGQGWQTSKNHEQLHVPDDIEAYGAPRNTNSGSAEHNHIDNVKKPAKMTQRRKSVLDWQIANRRADAYILELAYNLMVPTVIPPDALVNIPVENHGISHRGAKGYFQFQAADTKIRVSFKWTSATDVGPLPFNVTEYIVQYFSNHHMDGIDELIIPFFTEYKREGITFRAHHNYHHGGNAKWYDWVMFRWRKEQRPGRRNRSSHAVDVAYMDDVTDHEQFDYAPAKILGFLKIGGALSCIVRPCTVEYIKSSVFTTKWTLAFWDKGQKKPMICLASVDAIVRHCLMIPSNGDSSVEYHEVYERSRWANEFHEDI
jgi:hypothetical protein